MNFDLERIYREWGCPPEELSARVIAGQDGVDIIQLRVELGILQMQLDGRPDGHGYRGGATVLEYLQARDAEDLDEDAHEQIWADLRRELNQFNYRRLAFSSLADEAVHEDDTELIRLYLARTLRDIDHCLAVLRFAQTYGREHFIGNLSLIPTLIFNRARLLARLRAAECRFDEAIEEAMAGAEALRASLESAGFDEQQLEEDAGISYLQQFARRLREQHGIPRTLKEQLCQAIEAEDFETAASLRDRLEARRGRRSSAS